MEDLSKKPGSATYMIKNKLIPDLEYLNELSLSDADKFEKAKAIALGYQSDYQKAHPTSNWHTIDLCIKRAKNINDLIDELKHIILNGSNYDGGKKNA